MTGAASILSECHISVSQEEVLASFCGGWERNGHFSFDETPNQHLSPSGVQQNLPNLDTRPPLSYEGDSAFESSASVDEEADMGFTQEPVEWISPSSSPQATEGDDGGNEGNDDRVAKEDSYVAAFESDRSQSPSQDWPRQIEQYDPQVETPNFGVSSEFLTQPALGGVMDFEFASSEDLEHQVLRQEAIPEEEFQGSSVLLLPPIPVYAVSEIEAPVFAGESCIQPFTQPALKSEPLQPLNKIQEPANQMQLAEGRNDIVHNPTLLDKERAATEEPQPMQQGSELDDLVSELDQLVRDTTAVNNNNGRTGEQTPQERGGDVLSCDSRLSVDDARRWEHRQQEHGSHEISRDIPHVEVHRSGSGLSVEKAQPLMQISEVVEEFRTGRTLSKTDQTLRGNGDSKSLSKALKRVDCATEELHGQQKRQRVEVSSVRAPRFPKTVMDVVRSRSRSLSNSLVDDECNILSIIMQAGTEGQNESASQDFQVLVQEFHAFVMESTTAKM